MRKVNKDWSCVPEHPKASAIRNQIAELTPSMEKLVIPDRLAAAERPPWENTRIISPAEACNEIAPLKAQEGRDIMAILSQPPAALRLIHTPTWPGSGNLPGVYQVTPVKP
jgi:hypothetical protein